MKHIRIMTADLLASGDLNPIKTFYWKAHIKRCRACRRRFQYVQANQEFMKEIRELLKHRV